MAETWAAVLGASAGTEAVADFAATGGRSPEYVTDAAGETHVVYPDYQAATAEELRATLLQGSWDEPAINAGAAQIDGCPKGHEDAYYEAYDRASRETVNRLADQLDLEAEAVKSAPGAYAVGETVLVDGVAHVCTSVGAAS